MFKLLVLISQLLALVHGRHQQPGCKVGNSSMCGNGGGGDMLDGLDGVARQSAPRLAWDDERFPSFSLLAASDPPFTSCGNALCFSGSFNNNQIFQRAPSMAAVYGSIPKSSPAGATVTVTLAGTAKDGTSYSKAFPTTINADYTFKALFDPMVAGGNYTFTAVCPTCPGPTVISYQGATFGDVWVCSGQSNMALQLFNTYERNTSFAMALAGKYANVRFMMVGLGTASPQQDGNWLLPVGVNSSDCSVSGYANGQWCSGSELARFPVPEMQQSPFMRILALPYYWAERLTDLMGDEAIPLGLVFNPVGGTMIEQWTPYAEQLVCTMQACMCSYQCNGTQPLSPTNQSQCDRNAQLWRGDMQPIVNMTIKGWLWYQGENNCGGDAGSSLYGTGYGCMLPAMVAAWRKHWSAVPGTTDPLAYFGSVSLHDGGDEGGGANAQPIRWSQSANYGTLANNPVVPNAFIAESYDAGDHWEGWECHDVAAFPSSKKQCCVPKDVPLGTACVGDHRGEYDNVSTHFYMGTLHPRTKLPPSLRLAQATYSTVYAPATPLLASGPVLRDCAVTGTTLTVRFNATLLKGERVVISVPALADPPSLALENTAFYALVNATLPSDLDHNHRIPGINYQGPFAGGNEFGVTGWVALLPVASASDPTAVTLDLAPLQGLTPTAIRYAVGGGGCWDGDPRVNGLCTRLCTGPHKDCTTQPCYPASCPIKSSASVAGGEELPAAPFVANIVNGKCQCLAPQVCG